MGLHSPQRPLLGTEVASPSLFFLPSRRCPELQKSGTAPLRPLWGQAQLMGLPCGCHWTEWEWMDRWGPSLTSPLHRAPFQSKSHGIQKKAYRVLEEVCASPQGPGARFVQNHLNELKKTLLDSLRSTSSPAKRVRTPGRPRPA